ncbi:interferon-induced protein 44-like isoform X1 [Takifugu rubripes]|uniref:interferon-induced protein 44-like isoform X1 n=1 Tax=Takifugu rubripes TaxID=31033 RepID=UPI0011460F51|nr:interferon-induced protein 44-like isoform X1 [Takifugu rubripes]
MAQAPDRSPWGKGKKMKYIKAIKEFKPIDGSVTKARILLLGPFGVGKSSFVNSVFSIFKDRISNPAGRGNPTSEFRPYLISDEGGTRLNLALCDTMGLAEEKGEGLHSDDIVSIIQGHAPDGYQFSPTSPMTPETAGYVAAPTPNKKIHCVVYVMDATMVSDMSADLQKKLGKIRQRVTSLKIPQLVLMTKVDKADSTVIKNIRKVDQSEIIREKKKQLAALLDVPISSIFPVKNYVPNDLELNDNCDVLLLTAINEMLSCTDTSMNDITRRLSALSTRCPPDSVPSPLRALSTQGPPDSVPSRLSALPTPCPPDSVPSRPKVEAWCHI